MKLNVTQASTDILARLAIGFGKFDLLSRFAMIPIFVILFIHPLSVQFELMLITYAHTPGLNPMEHFHTTMSE